MRRALIAFVVLLAWAPVMAQTAPPLQPAATPATPAPPAGKAAATPPPVTPPAQGPASPAEQPQGFTYNPEGRRDPFVSLLRRGADPLVPTPGSRPPGLAGLMVAEVALKGTLRAQEGFVAMLYGADQKTYIVRPGDRLLDGTIQSIAQSAIVIVQQVNDPLSLEKVREIRKTLRQTEAN